jgi:hypothetical protein
MVGDNRPVVSKQFVGVETACDLSLYHVAQDAASGIAERSRMDWTLRNVPAVAADACAGAKFLKWKIQLTYALSCLYLNHAHTY